MAQHAAKIMAAFRIKARCGANKFPLAHTWIAKVIDRKNHKTLAAVRKGLKKAGVIKTVRFPVKGRRAEIIRVEILAFDQKDDNRNRVTEIDPLAVAQVA